jgi:hypothetical protein
MKPVPQGTGFMLFVFKIIYGCKSRAGAGLAGGGLKSLNNFSKSIARMGKALL